MGEWQPIETAPKDGTIIQLYRPPSKFGTWCRRVTALWHVFEEGDGAWVWPDCIGQDIEDENRSWIANGDCYADNKSFTHWMPLPEPPAQEPSPEPFAWAMRRGPNYAWAILRNKREVQYALDNGIYSEVRPLSPAPTQEPSHD